MTSSVEIGLSPRFKAKDHDEDSDKIPMRILIIFLFSGSLMASESLSPCRFDLVGKSFPHDAFFEEKPMSADDCEKLAKKTLKKNQGSYLKAIIHDRVSGKLKLIGPEEKQK